MGRTIHFTAVFPERIMETDINILKQVSEKYNSGVYKDIWTCENFYFVPNDYKSISGDNDEFSNFCKVGENEFNSYLVLTALTEISLLLPDVEIYVHDEGKYLRIPYIILKNGLGCVDESEHKEYCEYLRNKGEELLLRYNKRCELFIEHLRNREYSFSEEELWSGSIAFPIECFYSEIKK